MIKEQKKYKHIRISVSELTERIIWAKSIPGCSLEDIAKEVVTLWESHPKVETIILEFNYERIEILPNYTAQDIENIYEISSNIQYEADEKKAKFGK